MAEGAPINTGPPDGPPAGGKPVPSVEQQVNAVFTPADERAMQELDLHKIAQQVQAEFSTLNSDINSSVDTLSTLIPDKDSPDLRYINLHTGETYTRDEVVQNLRNAPSHDPNDPLAFLGELEFRHSSEMNQLGQAATNATLGQDGYTGGRQRDDSSLDYRFSRLNDQIAGRRAGEAAAARQANLTGPGQISPEKTGEEVPVDPVLQQAVEDALNPPQPPSGPRDEHNQGDTA